MCCSYEKVQIILSFWDNFLNDFISTISSLALGWSYSYGTYAKPHQFWQYGYANILPSSTLMNN